MRLDISKFGQFLTSRPAGREAYLAARAYSLPKNPDEPIELDFSQVKVLTPSWIDEFLRGLEEEYGADRIKPLPSDNPSVELSLEAIKTTTA
ncbi:MAG: STAS-like domain-containing protein [Candidatus Andersenbacteria bacterium]|nr:STAS-like domain-containing protein [Candidatus Andersenbacteria bacterium]